MSIVEKLRLKLFDNKKQASFCHHIKEVVVVASASPSACVAQGCSERWNYIAKYVMSYHDRHVFLIFPVIVWLQRQ
jgi:hypothetical protein